MHKGGSDAEEKKIDELEHQSMSTSRVNDTVEALYIVKVIQADKLPSMDVGGGVDPFCIFKIGERQVFKTNIIKRSHAPQWNETFRTLVYSSEKKYNLNVEVWDWDKVSTNDYIGAASLDLSDLTKKKDTWVQITNEKGKYRGDLRIEISHETFQEVEYAFWKGIADHFDTDGDGEITESEFLALLESIGSPLSGEEMQTLFASLDANNSGSLSFVEFYEKVKGAGSVDANKHPLMTKLLPNDPNFIWVVMSQIDPTKETVGERVLEDSRWREKVKMPTGKRETGTSRIMVHDRASGKLVEERIPNYIKVAMRIMYTGKSGRFAEQSGKRLHGLLQSLTDKQGKKYDDPLSIKDIRPFMAFHNINEGECLDSVDTYKTFNEFFFRKLKKEARPISNPNENEVVVSPADCRLSVFDTISHATELWVKGKNFSLMSLLQDEDLASSFDGGSLAICRLAPQDYHRFHSPVHGKFTKKKPIPGTYFTVNPIAVNQETFDVYGGNKREVCLFTTPDFGRVVYVCVGATMVGSIRLTANVGDRIDRGSEFGYFAFGGSTILLLFRKGEVVWDKDLMVNSDKCLETLVKMGERIGTKAGYTPKPQKGKK